YRSVLSAHAGHRFTITQAFAAIRRFGLSLVMSADPTPASYPARPREVGARRAVDFAADLNEAQLAAATHGDGPLLIVAGAGTGKTRTLVYRVAHLIEKGV